MKRSRGSNHADGCDGLNWNYSGTGYNRVRLCACGAEDHDPTPESIEKLTRLIHDLDAD